jgi:hypothetical protein
MQFLTNGISIGEKGEIFYKLSIISSAKALYFNPISSALVLSFDSA